MRCARSRSSASWGATYFRGDINRTYAKYFADAGFDILDMTGMDVDFDKVQELSSREVYRFVKSVFLKNDEAQAIYMLGPAWRTLDIIEMLEQDLGVPVIHAIPAQCWDIQRHLHVRQPVKGFGRLIAEMPSPGNG
jgi:maleate isomerase